MYTKIFFRTQMNLDFIAEQGNKYELASGINNVKQDVTAETREFLEIQMEAEDNRDKARGPYITKSSHPSSQREC